MRNSLSTVLSKLLVLSLFITGCQKEDSKKDASQVAHLKNIIGDVNYRPHNDLVWGAARENMGLQNYDAVRTGEASSSRIVYSDHTQVQLSERTLVVVVDRKSNDDLDQSVVALPSGQIDGQLGDSKKKEVELVVRTKRGWIKASNRDKKKTKFTATITKKGHLKVKNKGAPLKFIVKGQEKTLPKDKALVVEAPKGEMVKTNDEQVQELAKAETTPPAIEEARVTVGTEAEVEEKAQALEEGRPEPQPTTEPPVEAKPTPTFTSTLEPPKEKGMRAAPVTEFFIHSPKHKSSTTKAQVTVKGAVPQGTTVYLNGQKIAVKDDRSFTKPVALNPGINLLTFQIVNTSTNKVRYETREVIRK